MPRVEHTEGRRHLEQIVEQEVIVELLAEREQKTEARDDVPEGAVHDHGGVEAAGLVVKGARADQNQVVEDERHQRILIAERVLLLEHDDDADAKREHVALELLLDARQVNDERAVLDEHEDVGELVPAIHGQKNVVLRLVCR